MAGSWFTFQGGTYRLQGAAGEEAALLWVREYVQRHHRHYSIRERDMGFIQNGQMIAAYNTQKQLEKTHKQQGAGQDAMTQLLERLLWETQQNNKMLWVSLNDEQRAAFHSMQ